MDFDNSRLASRLRDALEEQEAADVAAREAAARIAEEGGAARLALLDGLARFAGAIGHVEVERIGAGGVLLRRGLVSMAFEPEVEGSGVRVAWDRAPHRTHRVVRELQLQGRWVWEETFAGRTERRPFDEKALEELLARGLDLPRVTAGDPERPMSRRTAEVLLEPSGPTPRAVAARAEPAPVEGPPLAAAAPTEPRVGPDGARRRRL